MKQENIAKQEENSQAQKKFEEKRAEAFKEFMNIHFCQTCLDQFAASS